jgi:methylmalonyl-CoA mutase
LTKQKSGLVIKPYYDVLDQRKEENILLRDTVKSGVAVNAPKIVVQDAKAANEAALAHLRAGAEGIYFHLATSVSPNVLLKEIDLSICSVFFQLQTLSQHEFISSLKEYVEKHKLTDKINGAIFQETASAIIQEGFAFSADTKFRSNGILVSAKEDIVDEIVDALCAAVDIIEHLKSDGIKAANAFASMAFSVSINTNFFLSIAKIRAFRKVWITLQQAYGIASPTEVYVHAMSTPWISENFQPHGNLLKQTTASMAAFMAGCDALTVEAEDPTNPMMVRIARNVPAVLNDESHLGKVVDPLAGSYFVDHLTHQVAAAAWKKFQQTV